MNTRQKAKHFKKMYEELRKRNHPKHRFVESEPLQHFVVGSEFSIAEIDAIKKRDKKDMQDWVTKKLAYRIACELEKQLPYLIVVNKDDYSACFHFWVRREI